MNEIRLRTDVNSEREMNVALDLGMCFPDAFDAWRHARYVRAVARSIRPHAAMDLDCFIRRPHGQAFGGL